MLMGLSMNACHLLIVFYYTYYPLENKTLKKKLILITYLTIQNMYLFISSHFISFFTRFLSQRRMHFSQSSYQKCFKKFTNMWTNYLNFDVYLKETVGFMFK